jgi:hypothetical protein
MKTTTADLVSWLAENGWKQIGCRSGKMFIQGRAKLLINDEVTAEEILAVANSLERKTRQYENGEFTD